MFEIYTDGSCDVFGTKNGSSAYVILKDKTILHEEVTFYLNTTNNRCEYSAAINALKYLSHEYGSSEYVLHSDSDLLVMTANVWMHKWKIKNWKNGKVKNLDLVHQIYDLYEFHKGKFKWVKGHAGNEWNEYCDQLCRESDLKNNHGGVFVHKHVLIDAEYL